MSKILSNQVTRKEKERKKEGRKERKNEKKKYWEKKERKKEFFFFFLAHPMYRWRLKKCLKYSERNSLIKYSHILFFMLFDALVIPSKSIWAFVISSNSV